MPPFPLRIAVIGSGALASLFAARLHPTAAVVMLASWPDAIAAVNRDGLRVLELDGSMTVWPVRATAAWDAEPPVQAALVLVKSYQTAAAAVRARAVLAPDGVAVTLQNGLGNREQLAAVLGLERTAVGVTTIGATLVQPGVVRHAGRGGLWLARAPEYGERLDGLIACLAAAGLEPQIAPTAEGLLWGKVAVNAAINPLTALLGVPNGRLLEDARLLDLMTRAAQEAQAVATALGVVLPYADAAAQARLVAAQTAANRSSMLQDLDNGRPTEIDAICGAIVRAGRACGVPTPVNDWLLAAVAARTAVASP